MATTVNTGISPTPLYSPDTAKAIAASKEKGFAAIAEYNALRDSGASTAEKQVALDRAGAAIKETQAIKDAALANGGTLPGSSPTDSGIPVTSTRDSYTVYPTADQMSTNTNLNSSNSSVNTGSLSGSDASSSRLNDGSSTVSLGSLSTTSGNISPVSSEPANTSLNNDRTTNNATSGATTVDPTTVSTTPASSDSSSQSEDLGQMLPTLDVVADKTSTSIASTSSDASNVGSATNPAATVNLIAVGDQRIRLTPKNMKILGDKSSMLAPLIETLGLMFPYTPIIQYIGGANYGTQSLVHSNQDFRPFTSGMTTTFTIAGPFTAQTTDEAKYMMACLHFLRTVTKMRFGTGDAIGLPPPVLILNGYGIAMLNNLPVIITNFSMELPNNVDYVKVSTAGGDAWMPTHTTISVTCVVQNTPNKLRLFNWDDFASGALLKNGGWS